MNGMQKLIKRILLLILGIVVLFLLNIAWHRLRGPTQEERAALAIAQAPVVKPLGRNAFALTWLYNKDVPDADIERLAAQDLEYARTSKAMNREELQFPSAALPELDMPATNTKTLCAQKSDDCLATVRDNADATRALLARHDRLLQRAIALEQFEFLYNELPRVVSMSLLGHNGMAQQLRSSHLALMFHDGEREQAVAGVCGNLAMWRRFGRDNRSLLQTMIGVARRDEAITLLADMLAEWEQGLPLPAECAVALAPVAAEEVSLCSSMLGEFDYVDGNLETLASTGRSGGETTWLESRAQPLLFDASRTRAWDALHKTRYCEPEVAAQMLQDQSFEQPPLAIDWLDCQANMMGCILTRVAAPAYNDYVERLLDAAAHLRLAATLAWLRETESNGHTVQEQFDSRPEALRSGSRASGISDDGRTIWVDNLHAKRAARFSLPLGPSKESAP